MRFFSIEKLKDGALESIKRFPVIVLLSIIGTSAAVWYAGLEFNEEQDYWYILNLIVGLSLSVSLLLALAIYAERRSWAKQSGLLLQLTGTAGIALYIYTLPDLSSNAPEVYLIRHFLLFASLHLAVALAPYFEKGEVNGFWQYNKSLFLRILISAFYSAALFIGLSVALLAMDNLLGFEVKGVRYLQLWITMIGLFNTLFFLAGVPKEYGKLELVKEYPKGLRVFSQYVLIPLVTVYILILYAYTAKIIIEWAWPNGWVANLVLSFSLVGILSILLLYPLKDDSEHTWIRTFSKTFYYSLIPLVVLLILSIYVRVSEYGITENRFFVATLAVWLTFIVIYFILSKEKNIKIIPFSLLIGMLGISFGPFSAFNVSKRNQLNRLETKLISLNIIQDDFVSKDHEEVSFDDAKQISSMVTYLVDVHGLTSIQHFFSEPLDSLDIAQNRNWVAPSEITDLMGVNYVHEWDNEPFETSNTINIYRKLHNSGVTATQTTGYDWHTNINFLYVTSIREITVGDRSMGVNFDKEGQKIVITEEGKDSIEIELTSLVSGLLTENRYEKNELFIDSTNFQLEDSFENMEVRIIFKQIEIENLESKIIGGLNAHLLINLK